MTAEKNYQGSGGKGLQWGCRGKVPAGGLGATPPDAVVFLLFVIQKVPLKCILNWIKDNPRGLEFWTKVIIHINISFLVRGDLCPHIKSKVFPESNTFLWKKFRLNIYLSVVTGMGLGKVEIYWKFAQARSAKPNYRGGRGHARPEFFLIIEAKWWQLVHSGEGNMSIQ